MTGLKGLQRELAPFGRNITIHHTDISQEHHIIAARADVLRAHGHIDILINNAAVSISQTFEQLDLVDFHKLFEVNFWGAVYCCKYFLPDLKKQADSRLVNIISDFALMGFPGKTTYGSSKSALMGFSQALKTELAGSSVKVSLVIPPPLDTGIVKNGLHIDEIKRQKEADFLKRHGMPLALAAEKIVRNVEKGKFRIIIGAMMFGADLASRFFPTLLHFLIGKSKNRIDFV